MHIFLFVVNLLYNLRIQTLINNILNLNLFKKNYNQGDVYKFTNVWKSRIKYAVKSGLAPTPQGHTISAIK